MSITAIKDKVLEYVNNSSVATGVLIIIILSGITFIFNASIETYQKANYSYKYVIESEKSYEEEVKPLLSDILKEVKSLKSIMYTMIGEASILEYGDDEEFIYINKLSRAVVFKDVKVLEVTSLEKTGPSREFEIRGTILGDGALIYLSNKAAISLGLEGKEKSLVRITVPDNEDQ